jgi:Mg2+ and Co2+ transporter CorA
VKVRCVYLDHPTVSELELILREFELGLKGRKLHETAISGLMGEDALAFREPFPKIESHDAYLYGMLATPTDIEDGRSDFFSVQFIVSESMAVIVLWGPDELAQQRAVSLFSTICADGTVAFHGHHQTQEDPGDVVVRLARAITVDLQSLVGRLHSAVLLELQEIESALFDEYYQSMSADASRKYRTISRLKFEILSIESMIEETQNVFQAIASARVLIRPPFTSGESELPPFSSDQRIWVEDLLMRARSLKAQRNGLEEEVRLLYERLESLETRRQTAAQMRFAAVASILLLPALIVGFFGQNFEINPWFSSTRSWGVSAVILVAMTVFQFIYFKRRKWL